MDWRLNRLVRWLGKWRQESWSEPSLFRSFGPQDAHRRVLAAVRHHGREGVLGQLRVGIQEKDELARRPLDAAVAAGGEADVGRQADEGRLRELGLHHLGAPVPGGVVHHDDLAGHALCVLQDRGQAAAQVVPPVEADHDHRQVHALCTPSSDGLVVDGRRLAGRPLPREEGRPLQARLSQVGPQRLVAQGGGRWPPSGRPRPAAAPGGRRHRALPAGPGAVEATTGRPQAIASSGGRPKPSYSEGKTNRSARL